MLRKAMAIVALTAAAMVLGLNISAVLGENQAGSDGSNLEKLVQQMTDTRSNYGENLHQLIDYYKKLGDSQGERLAKQELKDFGKIHQRMYLQDIKARLLAVNTAAWAESDIVEALVALRAVFEEPVPEGLLMRALTYFDDAEREAPLPGEGERDWETVKRFFLERVGQLIVPPPRRLEIQARVVDLAG